MGDLLVIDGQWGTVKEIRVRSTIFETFDRPCLIIPNSELISDKVLNWTHYGRASTASPLGVGVACDSDVRQVTQLTHRDLPGQPPGGAEAAAPDPFRVLRRQHPGFHHLGAPQDPRPTGSPPPMS